MPRLLLKKKEEVITEYVVKKSKTKIFIGSKKGNDVVIPDKKNVSEQHCVIIYSENKYSLKDQNTIIGTQVNGRNINEVQLNFGDEITISEWTISFLDDISVNKYDDLFPQYYLIGIYGKFYGKKFVIKQQNDTFIGREQISPRGIENDIVLSGDMTVSKGHAKISGSENEYTITDIGSTGGVAVNGEKLGQLNTTPIKVGDEISIGRTIFRIVDYYNENYSLPLRQNLFALKFLKVSNILITLIFVLCSLYLFVFGYGGLSLLNSGNGKPQLTLNSNWSKEVPMKIDDGDYNVTSTPVIADFNGDGINDIAMLCSAGFLYAWDGKKGNLLWNPIEIYNSGVASLVSDDVNNDGFADVIAVSESGMLYVIDGQMGASIIQEMLGGELSALTPVVCDLDLDGKKDIVVVSQDGTVHFLYSPGFPSYQKQTEFIDGPVYGSPVILQRKNFSPSVVIANYNSKVFFINGTNRTKKIVDLDSTGKAHLIAGAPAVGDINGDGINEIVVQSNVPQYITAIDTTKYSVLWTYFVEPTPSEGLKFNTTPVIADFTGKGINDVLFVSANGSIQILKGNTTYQTGELLWKFTIPEAKRILSTPAVFDFDKDGINEVIFGTEDGRILIMKSNIKRKELEIAADIRASNSAITSTPLLADLNGDKKIEVLYVNKLDAIHILNTNVKTLKNLSIWPMFLGNSQHTGTNSLDEYKMKYKIMMFGGIILILLFLVLKIRASIKKSSKKVKVVYL
ncbi:FHA domain-containing protein [Candidatus Ruminimicrobium bovinum]|uniref:FHA domain-containing protein n=1 Tax=Candidatus Ruminimicrobium bovinum TaxID=3242779 RepID=UPI0039B98F87